MVKGQVKIQQTAFMLIAITIFFVLVGLFAFSMSFSGMKQKATELEAENALNTIKTLSGTPEFSCETAYSGTKTNCIDSDKAMVIKKNIDLYKDFWGVSNIEIRKIYPLDEISASSAIKNDTILCSEDNYPDCNTLRIISDKISGTGTYSFVSLCKKESFEGAIYNKCELAVISIFYEKKE